MPKFWSTSTLDEPVQHYCFCEAVPSFLPDPDDAASDYLMAERKVAAQEMQDWKELQSIAARDKDFKLAKFYKACGNDAQRRYKALCFIIPHYVGNPPGDAKKLVPVAHFPLELDSELTTILSHISIL